MPSSNGCQWKKAEAGEGVWRSGEGGEYMLNPPPRVSSASVVSAATLSLNTSGHQFSNLRRAAEEGELLSVSDGKIKSY